MAAYVGCYARLALRTPAIETTNRAIVISRYSHNNHATSLAMTTQKTTEGSYDETSHIDFRKKNYTIIRSSIIGENPGSSTPKFLIQVVSFLDQYITHLAEASFGDESMQRADVTKFPPISRPYVKHLTKIINYKLK